MYNKFYFLHVPKTGGRFLKNNFICKFPSSIKVIEGQDRHSGWDKQIDENTYIFSVIREPLEMICSLYAHIIASKANMLFKDSVNNLGITNIHLDKEAFIKWIGGAKQYHNIQSKNFLISGPVFDNLYNYSIFSNLNEDLLWERLNRVNLLVSHDILLEDVQFVTKKICKDLNIENISFENDKDTYSNPGSRNLYLSLNDYDKEKISNFFKIDYKVYERVEDINEI